ncbi:anti-sigma factor [Nocardioides jishulii]|uniref:Regulator of SigK n=1 Tax=Nocardioides jishulii TaxID=2575440 RepID=A0A4U2YR87_9ACTN|nr:anti-sigma factor [Nocardioides jishulii]QCX26240.1 anti-sigma factor [Nocardioides jishulii]TKI63956.1 anti-sigma factor [Nocardioides jishulii]
MNDIHLLSGAYALGALGDLEEARLEGHLVQCPECTEEVRSLRETAALLAEDLATTPPPELRGAVLDEISRVRPLPPVVPQLRRRAMARLLPLLVAAAVLVVGTGVLAWRPWSSQDMAPTAVPTAAERVLQADDAVRAVVDLGEAGRATVVRSASENRAVIVTERMAAPPEGKVFQVWLQTPDDDMVPAAVMAPVPDQTVLLDGDAAEAVGAGITLEPEGGSPSPTTEPIALFDLA